MPPILVLHDRNSLEVPEALHALQAPEVVRVEKVSEADEALNTRNFAVLIIDGERFAIDDFQLVRGLRKRHQHVPIILVTDERTQLPEKLAEELRATPVKRSGPQSLSAVQKTGG